MKEKNSPGGPNPKKESSDKIEEYENTLRRLQADFENYIKRVEKEKEEFANYSNHKLVSKLVSVIDDFEKALEVINGNKEVSKGVRMIHGQFKKVLDEEGVKPIKSVGEKLDPFMHEVVDVVDGDKDDLVVEELQKGYMMKDKVLRSAKVRISKCKGDENV